MNSTQYYKISCNVYIHNATYVTVLNIHMVYIEICIGTILKQNLSQIVFSVFTESCGCKQFYTV